MKKRILLLLLTITLAVSSLPAGAVDVVDEETQTDIIEDVTVVEEVKPQGFTLVINGMVMEYTSVIRDGVHFVPVRQVFEKLGSKVFYRYRDRQILALSRDGDTIQHIVGTNIATLNGVAKSYRFQSFMENGATYIPVEMIATLFRTNDIFHDHDKKQLSIKMPFTNTDYNKLVNDVLYASKNSSFYPEKFKRYINYHAQKPASTMNDVIFMVNIGLDFPFYENIATIANPYSYLVLVNKYNKLPAGFSQKNLVKMDGRYTNGDNQRMESTAYQKFAQMSEAARKDGVYIRAASTYRTEDYQGRLYNKYLRTTGQRNADSYSARPGHSEHQTGLAVDINYTGTSFENTAAFKWLMQHAHEYGYILRYPKGKTWITGYAYEPWHYRYVGVDAATIIHKEDITYEQYFAKYIAVNEFK